jgi:hypothetical protein
MRVDKAQDYNARSPSTQPSQESLLSTPYAGSARVASPPNMQRETSQLSHIQDDGGVVGHQRNQTRHTLLPRDDKFDNIIRDICEAPSACLPKGLVHKEDFRSSSSTLLHYIAARGRLSNVLMEVMLSCTCHGDSIDTLDGNGFTALHIAVQHDRIENVKVLLTAGALFDAPDPYGELPLHVAIISSNDTGLVDELLFRHKDRMDMKITGSSKRAGQTALDLVVERALREVTLSGDAVFTPTTKRILSAVLLQSSGVPENVEFLRNHARIHHTPLSRATEAISKLSPRGAQHLAVTMASAVRAECRRHGSGYCHGADLARLLSSAWQNPSCAIMKPDLFPR